MAAGENDTVSLDELNLLILSLAGRGKTVKGDGGGGAGGLFGHEIGLGIGVREFLICQGRVLRHPTFFH